MQSQPTAQFQHAQARPRIAESNASGTISIKQETKPINAKPDEPESFAGPSLLKSLAAAPVLVKVIKTEKSFDPSWEDGFLSVLSLSQDENEEHCPVIKTEPKLDTESSSPISYHDSDSLEEHLRQSQPPSSHPRESDESSDEGPRQSPPPSSHPREPESSEDEGPDHNGDINTSATIEMSSPMPTLAGDINTSATIQMSSPMPTLADMTIAKTPTQSSRLTPSSIIYNPLAMERKRQAGQVSRPRHRESIVDLKGILKTAQSYNKRTRSNLGLSSPLEGDVLSSPTDRIQHTKQNAKTHRVPSSDALAGQSSARSAINRRPTQSSPLKFFTPRKVHPTNLSVLKPIRSPSSKCLPGIIRPCTNSDG